MNDTKPNGGPAFPIPHTIADANDPAFKLGSCGMSLRDYFAGQALAGVMSNSELQFEVVKVQIRRKGQEDFLVGQCIARHCFDMADAMIAARNS